MSHYITTSVGRIQCASIDEGQAKGTEEGQRRCWMLEKAPATVVSLKVETTMLLCGPPFYGLPTIRWESRGGTPFRGKKLSGSRSCFDASACEDGHLYGHHRNNVGEEGQQETHGGKHLRTSNKLIITRQRLLADLSHLARTVPYIKGRSSIKAKIVSCQDV